jgi:hypothetical protein
MVHAVPEAVAVVVNRHVLPNIDPKGVASLRGVAHRLHAEFAEPFCDWLGVFNLCLVLDFEDHRSLPG